MSAAGVSALVNQCAHILALHGTGNVVRVGQIEHEDGPVSYTHLDVYKRQPLNERNLENDHD